MPSGSPVSEQGRPRRNGRRPRPQTKGRPLLPERAAPSAEEEGWFQRGRGRRNVRRAVTGRQQELKEMLAEDLSESTVMMTRKTNHGLAFLTVKGL